MAMLVRCLYASRSATPIGADVLDAILTQSLAHNPAHGITGLLCAADDVFVQVLEGDREAVSDLYAAIAADRRHTRVRLLRFEEIAERRFAHWTMGSVHLDRANPTLLLKYSPWPRFDPFALPAEATMRLLEELLAAGAIQRRAGG
jgi:hypothetical protein